MKLSELKTLKESTEVHVVHPRPMNSVELTLSREFQKFCSIIYDYLKGDMSKVDLTAEHVSELLTKLKKFNRYKFLNQFTKELEDGLKSHEKMLNGKGKVKKNLKKFSKDSDDILDYIVAGDYDSAHTMSQGLAAMIDEINAHINVGGIARSRIKGAFTAQPTIFGTTRLLDFVDAEMYKKIIELDLSNFKYTYLEFPKSKLDDDFHYVLNFMNNLVDSTKPLRVKSKHDFRLYLKTAYAGKPEFEELKELFDRYLHSNNKSLIPKIMTLIEKYPAIKTANDRAKKRIKYVYRGLGFGSEVEDISEDDVVEQDKEAKFVATSTSRTAAKNFAFQKGHLDADRRSDYGYIIKYKVDSSSIILDTSIFETIYGESEVLVDTTKAEVIDVERV